MNQDNGDIRVADITLAQLSRGLYRSNATVFKELINNAYDADATEVHIYTNSPEFNFISCVDNGKGMPLEKFINHFKDEGIGSSTKRRNSTNFAKNNRPIIGRLGIGMMAMGQLCHSFEIETHYIDEKNKKGKAYKAEIILTDDNIIPTSQIIEKEDFNGKNIDIGKWSYEEIEFDDKKKGFRIFSSDVRKTFHQSMKDSINSDSFNVPYSLNLLIDTFYKQRSVRECKSYLEMIWELSLLCPLPYHENEKSPININQNKKVEIQNPEVVYFLQTRNKEIKDYDFNVYFDGILLKRLIQIPTNDESFPKLYFVNFNQQVFESTLKFSGYIFSQIPRAITPFELNGLQIRLRNVGIGGYSNDFFKYYEQANTIRERWVTGEIFVDKGLETALNIDRDSFNEHEEHYKKFQKEIHEKLRLIFNEANKVAKKINSEKKEKKEKLIKEKIQTIIKEKSSFKVLEEGLDEKIPFEVDEKKLEITLNSNYKLFKKESTNQLQQLLLLGYELSKVLKRNETEKDQFYQDFINNILKQTT